MKAYKCDRCGRVFESEVENEKYLITTYDYDSYFILCEDCQNELEKWMDLFKENITEESEG